MAAHDVIEDAIGRALEDLGLRACDFEHDEREGTVYLLSADHAGLYSTEYALEGDTVHFGTPKLMTLRSNQRREEPMSFTGYRTSDFLRRKPKLSSPPSVTISKRDDDAVVRASDLARALERLAREQAAPPALDDGDSYAPLPPEPEWGKQQAPKRKSTALDDNSGDYAPMLASPWDK